MLARTTRSITAASTRLNRVSAVRCFAYKDSGPADTPTSQASAAPTCIKQGATLPLEQKVWIYKEGVDKPEEVPLGNLIKGKKAVLFGLPGAFTSVCSSKHVPEYASKSQELKAAGVDVVACLSVNDAYVMRKWAEDLKVDPNAMMMLGDGDASLHKALGLVQTLPGLGERARRYSIYAEDGVVKVLNVEEPGGMSYKVSGPSHMLDDLKNLKK